MNPGSASTYSTQIIRSNFTFNSSSVGWMSIHQKSLLYGSHTMARLTLDTQGQVGTIPGFWATCWFVFLAIFWWTGGCGLWYERLCGKHDVLHSPRFLSSIVVMDLWINHFVASCQLINHLHTWYEVFWICSSNTTHCRNLAGMWSSQEIQLSMSFWPWKRGAIVYSCRWQSYC